MNELVIFLNELVILPTELVILLNELVILLNTPFLSTLAYHKNMPRQNQTKLALHLVPLYHWNTYPAL